MTVWEWVRNAQGVLRMENHASRCLFTGENIWTAGEESLPRAGFLPLGAPPSLRPPPRPPHVLLLRLRPVLSTTLSQLEKSRP